MTTETIETNDPNITPDGTLIGIETKNIERVLQLEIGNQTKQQDPIMVDILLAAQKELNDVRSLLKRVDAGESFGAYRTPEQKKKEDLEHEEGVS